MQLMVPLLCPASSSERTSFPGISWQENIMLFMLCVGDGTGGERRIKSLLRFNCFLARGALEAACFEKAWPKRSSKCPTDRVH